MNHSRLIVAAGLALTLAGCGDRISLPAASLPNAPLDLRQCFNRSVGKLPNRSLTVAEVERAWKSDRLRAVVMQRCGKRFVAWYGALQGGWK